MKQRFDNRRKIIVNILIQVEITQSHIDEITGVTIHWPTAKDSDDIWLTTTFDYFLYSMAKEKADYLPA